MDEFEIYLMSSGSMSVYPENTLSHFVNMLSNTIYLEGDWRVALSEISYPTSIKNVTTEQVGYMKFVKKGELAHKFEFVPLKQGVYCSVEEILEEVKNTVSAEFDYFVDKETQYLTLDVPEEESLVFTSSEIPNMLGLKTIEKHWHAGMYWIEGTKNKEPVKGVFPVDIMSGKQLMFIYLDIIDYQYVGDTKAPLLRVISTKFRTKDGCLNNTQNIQHEKFDNLQYKKLLSNSISSIRLELRNETGKFVPFNGTGTVAITLKFKKF